MLVKISTGKVSTAHKFNDNLSLAEFKHQVSEKLGIPDYEMDILVNYPPVLVDQSSPDSGSQPISNFKIAHGSVVQIRSNADRRRLYTQMIEMGFEPNIVRAVVPLAKNYSLEHAITLYQSKISLTEGRNVESKLSRRVIPSNNSCLFIAIAYLFENDETIEKSDEYRKLIASAIRDNPSIYTADYLDKEPADYISWIQDRKHWGGEIEIAILSEKLQVEIAVIDIRSDIVLIYGEGSNFSSRIYLLYDNIHYDAIIEEKVLLTNNQRVVIEEKKVFHPIEDAHVLEEAKKLGKELHNSKQFVNLTTGSFFCDECLTTFPGEKAAIEHAKATGHTNFRQS